MDWTAEKVREAERHVKSIAHDLRVVGYSSRMVALFRENGLWVPDEEVVTLLAGDLNTSGALARLHQLPRQGTARQIVSFAASVDLLGLVVDWDNIDPIAGISVGSIGEHPASGRIAALLLERQRAKSVRNFARADQIRDAMKNAGVVVTDTSSGGSTFTISADFNEASLDDIQ